MYYVHQFALRELDIQISIGSLKREFDCQRVTVKRSVRNGLEPPTPHGRHNAFPDDSEAEAEAEADMLVWIQHQAEKFQPSPIYETRHPPLLYREIRQGYYSRVGGFIPITG
jgi:hypothetical protein